MKKGQAVLRDPAAQRVRALQMLEFKIRKAATVEEIADEFNVHPNTVKRALSFAKKADLITAAEDRILQNLVPEAEKALLAGLQSTDSPIKAAELALKLLEGFVPALKKKQGPAANASGGVVDELERYISALRADTSDQPPAVEGQVVQSLPPAAASAAPQGLLEPDRGDADRDSAPASGQEDVGEELDGGTARDASGG